jgi:hypothetical protein
VLQDWPTAENADQEEGIDLNKWQDELEKGDPMQLRDFIRIIHSKTCAIQYL